MEYRIKELEGLIKLKRAELQNLKIELASAKVDNLYKEKGMKKNQRFLYEGKECFSLSIDPDDGWFFSAKRIKKDGTISNRNITIYNTDKIEPIDKFGHLDDTDTV